MEPQHQEHKNIERVTEGGEIVEEKPMKLEEESIVIPYPALRSNCTRR